MKHKQLLRTLLLGLLLQAAASMLHAQENTLGSDWGNFTMPSPELVSTAGTASVNESTGTPNVAIPITSIQQGGLTLPVSLNYGSAGVRINDRASFAGMGWTLSAGGSITRIVKGLIDHLPEGYNNTYNQSLSVEQVHSGAKDAEPDVYIFNVCGRSGKFIRNPVDGKFYPYPYENLQITSSPGMFTMLDENGNKYIFDLFENTQMSNNQGNILTDYRTGWFLTRIVLTDNSEITFEYNTARFENVKTGVRETDFLKRQIGYIGGTGCWNPNLIQPNTYTRIELKSTYDTYRISRIVHQKGTVEFIYNVTARIDEDMPGDHALKEIRCYDAAHALTKTHLLSYMSYINTSNRLMLAGIQEKGILSGTLPAYQFDYFNSYSLPAAGTSTSSQDIYGYFNGASPVFYNVAAYSTKTTLLPPIYEPQVTGPPILIHTGADRSVSPQHTKTLMLKKITYPNGKVTEYEYEGNLDNDYKAGVRVSHISSSNGIDSKIYYKYIYSDPLFTHIEKFHQILLGQKQYVNSDPQAPNPRQICQGDLRMADSRYRVNLVLDNPIRYGTVEIVECTSPNNPAGTKIGSTVNKYLINGITKASGVDHIHEYMLGSLASSEVKDKSGQTVKKTSYTYQEEVLFSLNGSVAAVTAVVGGYDPYNPNVYLTNTNKEFVLYKLYVGKKRLLKIKDASYGFDGTYAEKVTSLEYANSDYTYPTSKKISYQDGSSTTEIYKRPADYVSGAPSANGDAAIAIKGMYDSHMFTPVIETVVLKNSGYNEIVIGASLTNFLKISPSAGVNLYVPAKGYQLKIPAPIASASFSHSQINGGGYFIASTDYEKIQERTSSDEHGHMLEMINTVGKEAQIYAPLIGKTTCVAGNASFSDIAYTSFEKYEFEPVPVGVVTSGNWIFSSAPSTFVSSAYSFAGSSSMHLVGPIVTSQPLTPGVKYVLTFWKKQGGSVTVRNAAGSAIGASILESSNGWDFYRIVLTNETGIGLSGNSYIDELKLVPIDSRTTTAVYKQGFGTVSECDERNYYTHFEYDEFGRLIYVYDHEKNIIKQYEYGIQESQN